MKEEKNKYHYLFYQALFLSLLLSFARKLISFESQILETIMIFLLSLTVYAALFLMYLAFKFRILLINCYWITLMANIRLLTVDAFGMRLFSLDTTIDILKFSIGMLDIAFLLTILGVLSIKIKLNWISDTVNYPAKRILTEIIFFTILFQLAVRYVVANYI